MAATGAAGLMLAPRASGQSARSILAHPHLLEIFRDDPLVRTLGTRYREMTPAENDAETLMRAILADAAKEKSGPLAAQLQARVQQDFAQGRTVTLHGWILSVTEARQCALFSLLPG